MIRYLAYLLLYIPIQLFAYLITPLLPLFAVNRYGHLDNANAYGMGMRLPEWLAWFDTPDNSLYGDSGWQNANPYRDESSYIGQSLGYKSYWCQVRWLYRNSLYGFKWSVMSMPIERSDYANGVPELDYHTGKYGSFYITQPNGAWQYKSVRPFLGKILVLNFGWLLDDCSQERALFMCSPRLK